MNARSLTRDSLHAFSCHVFFFLADLRERKTIDRFVRSVAFHGPSLITLTKAEQGDSKESPINFLHSTSTDEGNIATDYFRSKLQVCTVRCSLFQFCF